MIASTNPLLLTTCKHWPHILRLDRTVPSLPPSSSSPTTLSSLAAPARSPLNGVPSSAARTSGSLFRSSSTHQQQQQQQQQQQHPQRSASTGSRFAGVARRQGSDGATHTDIPLMNKNFGLKTTRKRHVKKDEAVKKEIETLWQRGDCPLTASFPSNLSWLARTLGEIPAADIKAIAGRTDRHGLRLGYISIFRLVDGTVSGPAQPVLRHALGGERSRRAHVSVT